MATSTTSTPTDLPAEIFAVQTNVPLIHQVVVAQLAAARQGTHSTKNRGEVRGGGAKPYRQKGTGRARQGSIRAPQFTGGGTVHGPQPRDYAQRTPKKMKVAALRGALSDRARHERVHVLETIVTGDVPSAKQALATLTGLTERRNFLVVLTRTDEVGLKSVRNLQNVHVLVADQLNTYDVLCADDVVFTQAALDAFVAGSKGGAGWRQDTAASVDPASGGADPEAVGDLDTEPGTETDAQSDAGPQDVQHDGAEEDDK